MPEPASETTDIPPRIIRRVPASLYLLLFGQIRYAVHTGLDSDFKKLDEQLLDLLSYQQPENEFCKMQRTFNNWTKRLEAKEAQLDELITRLIVRCIELNVATDAEIAEIEEVRRRGSAGPSQADSAT